MIRVLAAIVVLLTALPVTAATDTTALDRAAADALAEDRARLARVRARSASDEQAAAAAAARARSDRALIAALERDIDAAGAKVQRLMVRRAALDDQSDLIAAVALSVNEDQIARLRRAPIAAESPQRVAALAALTQSNFDLDRLYELWGSLHQELADAALVTSFETQVVFADGLPRMATVQRAGALALAADGRPATIAADGTIIEAPRRETDAALSAANAASAPGLVRLAPLTRTAGATESLAQRLYDASLIGWLILTCGVLALLHSAFLGLRWAPSLRSRSGRYERGLVLALAGGMRTDKEDICTNLDHYVHRQALRFAGSLAALKIFAMTAVLLGLLGTVVGMIQTFNVLRLYGGGDMRLAAAGIAQALSTTWLGLSVAIPVTFVHAGLQALARRLEDTLLMRARELALAPADGGTPLPEGARTAARGLVAPHLPGRVLALAAALVVGFGLFWLMHRLTVGHIDVPPVPAPIATVERVPLPRKTSPPPPPVRAPARRNLPSAPNALALALPIQPATIATAQPELPALAAAPTLTGLPEGRSALAGLGDGAWIGTATETEAFSGADQVPLTSAQPKYPRSAVNKKLEGEVELIFTITAGGRVTDIRILRASPRGVFEEAAAAALSQWLYPPFYQNGQPRARQATQLFEFRLADVQELYIYEDGS